jgi:hypothetical protein
MVSFISFFMFSDARREDERLWAELFPEFDGVTAYTVV